jgi:probable phosphoglycerate mutase
LADFSVEAIYSSPLKRALDTARFVAACHGLEVSIARGLADFNYGAWQGLTHHEVKETYTELYHRWLAEPHLVTMPDGESLDDVAARARQVVENVVDGHEGTVVLVSHRVVNKVLICSLLGLDNSHFWNIRQDVAGMTVFEYEGGRFILTRHNDTSHLGQARKHALSDF